jgi:hypothetical protein
VPSASEEIGRIVAHLTSQREDQRQQEWAANERQAAGNPRPPRCRQFLQPSVAPGDDAYGKRSDILGKEAELKVKHVGPDGLDQSNRKRGHNQADTKEEQRQRPGGRARRIIS